MENNRDKILVISHHPPPCKGGAAIDLYRLLKLFPKKAYVILATSFHKKQSDIDPELKLPCKYYNSVGITSSKRYTMLIAVLEWFLLPFMFINCLYVIKKEKISKILVHPITGTFLLTAYLAHKVTKIPINLYMLDLFEENQVKPLRHILSGQIERLAMQAASNVFVMSEGMQDYYFNKYNIKTVLLPHPIDLDDFGGLGESDLQRKEKCNILFTGGMIYDLQIDAIVNLVQAIVEIPEVEFHIYTRLSQGSLKRLGIYGENVICHEHTDIKTINKVQKQADILFLPNSFDRVHSKILKTASPVKMSEYLASGVPILVHAPPYAYISWYARKYGWGLVVDKPNPGLLKEAILKLLSNKKLQQDLVKNAQQTALLHDQDRVAGIFKKALGIA